MVCTVEIERETVGEPLYVVKTVGVTIDIDVAVFHLKAVGHLTRNVGQTPRLTDGCALRHHIPLHGGDGVEQHAAPRCRSEERRVGKECTARRPPGEWKEKM